MNFIPLLLSATANLQPFVFEDSSVDQSTIEFIGSPFSYVGAQEIKPEDAQPDQTSTPNPAIKPESSLPNQKTKTEAVESKKPLR